MARKTIIALTLAGGAALAAIPALAQDAPRPDCAADPAACQALVDRMGADRDERRDWRGGHGEERRGKHDARDRRHGGPGAWHGGMMQRFDADGDGRVSAEEAGAGVAAMVAQFDADGDQALTIEEFTALHAELMKPMTARMFGMLDNNADGRVDAAEADSAARRMGGGKGSRGAAAQPAPATEAPAEAPAAEGGAAGDPAAPAN